jgi:hypothetical protein
LRSGTTWNQQATFSGGSALADDNFGSAVAIDGTYAAIGTPGDDVGANAAQGTAYVFIRSGVNWTQQDYKTLPNGASADAFGSSISINGNWMVVGAPYDDHSGFSDKGSAHVFLRAGVNWSHEQLLTYTNVDNDHFGYSVSVSGNHLAVGAPADATTNSTGGGRAYILDASTWNNTPWRFLLNSIIGLELEEDDAYGFAVAVSANNLIVGAPFNDTVAASSGKAVLIQTDGVDHYFVRHIIDPIGGTTHLMGNSAAVTQTDAIIGAYYANGQRGKVLFLKL